MVISTALFVLYWCLYFSRLISFNNVYSTFVHIGNRKCLNTEPLLYSLILTVLPISCAYRLLLWYRRSTKLLVQNSYFFFKNMYSTYLDYFAVKTSSNTGNNLSFEVMLLKEKCRKSRQRGLAATPIQKSKFTNTDTLFSGTSPTLNTILCLHYCTYQVKTFNLRKYSRKIQDN